MPSLNQEILGRVNVSLPPTTAEQEAIAKALSDAHAFIESLEQLIVKKRHLKQGAMQELLRPKDRWTAAKLGSLGAFFKGRGVTRDESNAGDLPCVRYGEIYTRHHEHIKAFHSWVSQEIAVNARRLKTGDLLFAGSGETKEEIGKCVAFVDDREAYAGGDIVILRPTNEQTAIAAILSDMDAEIAALEAKLAKARQIKQGMMQNLLTGRIRLSMIGQSERVTQDRIIALFRDELHYRYLGDWRDRDTNTNIEESILTAYLTRAGYSPAQIAKATYALRTEADNQTRHPYANNEAVYRLLRYGVPVKIDVSKPTETVHLINWAEPLRNDFAIAEEVTLRGHHERRPDIVLYVNGIAVGVIELKNSRISIGDGIRQLLSNQSSDFNAWFFSTVQIVFAGSDSEGMSYGTTGTRREVLPEVEGGRTGRHPLQARQVPAQDVRQGTPDRADARFRALRRRHQEAPALPPVFRHQGRPAPRARAPGRHRLAHPGQRQEHRHGAAGQMDTGKSAPRPRGRRHRSR
jgi:hypothetical protein